MPEWYEIPSNDRTNEQNKRAQQAYYSVLLSTHIGREVVCDMKRRLDETVPDAANQNDNAVAQLWMEAFLKDTLTMCGLDNPMQITEAQARIAKNYIHKEEISDTPEGYAE